MIHKGEVIVARDPDLKDMYYCEIVTDGEENKGNLLCRILSMAHYPIQHAILDGSVPNENPPLPQGAKARLQFVRRVTTPDKWHHNYEDSVTRCLAEYTNRRRGLYQDLEDVPDGLRHGVKRPDKREFEILERHRHREYQAKRYWINH